MKDWKIRRGDFWLQWHDERAGWGEEEAATLFEEKEVAGVVTKLGKLGLGGMVAEQYPATEWSAEQLKALGDKAEAIVAPQREAIRESIRSMKGDKKR